VVLALMGKAQAAMEVDSANVQEQTLYGVQRAQGGGTPQVACASPNITNYL